MFKVRHIHNKIVSDKEMVLPSYLSFVFVQGQGASKWHIFDTQLEGIKSWLHPMADPHLAFVKSLLRYLISSFCLCSLLIIVEIQDWTADEIYFRYCHISWYFLQPGKYQLWCRWYRLKFWISVWRFPVILANSNSGAADTDWNEVLLMFFIVTFHDIFCNHSVWWFSGK